MISVLFVCLGNICRSPMAESVFTHLVNQAELADKIAVSSAATSTEEIGNSPHYGTRRMLEKYGVPLVPHRARKMTAEDGRKYDYLIGMDENNVRNMRRIVDIGSMDKIRMLLDFTPTPRAISDPWYTGNFEATYRDVLLGCRALLSEIRGKFGW